MEIIIFSPQTSLTVTPGASSFRPISLRSKKIRHFTLQIRCCVKDFPSATRRLVSRARRSYGVRHATIKSLTGVAMPTSRPAADTAPLRTPTSRGFPVDQVEIHRRGQDLAVLVEEIEVLSLHVIGDRYALRSGNGGGFVHHSSGQLARLRR